MDLTDAIYNWLSNFYQKEEDKSLFVKGSLIYVPFTPNNNEVNYILVIPLSKKK